MITEEEAKSKLPKRFWSKIKFGEPNECWEWQRAINHGYGHFNTCEKVNGKYVRTDAHRFMYFGVHQGADTNMYVLHECDNRKCCNPNHLWLGTCADNLADMRKKGRGYPLSHYHGAEAHGAKLTDALVRLIKIRLAYKQPIKKIAPLFGVTHGAISGIKTNRTWRHVRIIETPQSFSVPANSLFQITLSLPTANS